MMRYTNNREKLQGLTAVDERNRKKLTYAINK